MNNKTNKLNDTVGEIPFTLILKVLCIAWLLTALSPFIVLLFPKLFMTSKVNATNFISALTQLANYGELFGGMSVLIAGLGFAGVVYTIRLQVIEGKRNQTEQNKGYLLQGLIAAMQAYSAIYNADKEFYDTDYSNAPTSAEEAKKQGLIEQQYTVRGKMEHYTHSVEHIIAQIRNDRNFELP